VPRDGALETVSLSTYDDYDRLWNPSRRLEIIRPTPFVGQYEHRACIDMKLFHGTYRQAAIVVDTSWQYCWLFIVVYLFLKVASFVKLLPVLAVCHISFFVYLCKK